MATLKEKLVQLESLKALKDYGDATYAKNTEVIKEVTSEHVTSALGYTPLDSSKVGVSNGVASLDDSGKVPAAQLPGFVDDIVEGTINEELTEFTVEEEVITPEGGKIYVDINTNKEYRWSGTKYSLISETIALGETAETAFAGDKGKEAYDHSKDTETNPHNVTKEQIGLGNVGNYKAVSTVSGQGLSEAEKQAARDNIGAGTSNFDGNYSSLTGVPEIATVAEAKTFLGITTE